MLITCQSQSRSHGHGSRQATDCAPAADLVLVSRDTSDFVYKPESAFMVESKLGVLVLVMVHPSMVICLHFLDEAHLAAW